MKVRGENWKEGMNFMERLDQHGNRGMRCLDILHEGVIFSELGGFKNDASSLRLAADLGCSNGAQSFFSGNLLLDGAFLS